MMYISQEFIFYVSAVLVIFGPTVMMWLIER
jgi:hypothetical protein